jgi:hypothetical protein
VLFFFVGFFLRCFSDGVTTLRDASPSSYRGRAREENGRGASCASEEDEEDSSSSSISDSLGKITARVVASGGSLYLAPVF